MCALCKLHHRLVRKYLCNKDSWKTLSHATLAPRTRSWSLYFALFAEPARPRTRRPVTLQTQLDIEKDVQRCNFAHKEQVTAALTEIAALHSEIGYCQGMHLVVHFLLQEFRGIPAATAVFAFLSAAPFKLGELWEPEFPGLRLALFQLKFLLQFKLPILSQHFRRVDLNLDVIVYPWLLTVFVQLHAREMLAYEVLQFIWDCLLVNGWAALISTTLALLDIGQPLVLAADFDQTMAVYTEELHIHNLEQHMQKFYIDPKILSELENAFFS